MSRVEFNAGVRRRCAQPCSLRRLWDAHWNIQVTPPLLDSQAELSAVCTLEKRLVRARRSQSLHGRRHDRRLSIPLTWSRRQRALARGGHHGRRRSD